MIESLAARDAAIRAMLPLAGARGWNWAVIRAGLATAGEDPALAESWFPTGAPGAVAAWIDLADREMIDAAAAEDVTLLRVPARIRRVVELRLLATAPHKAALRRALSLLAIPSNIPVALRTTAATVDAMWHAAGDTSADFSWYTRRATLAAVYGTTLAFWTRNDDPAIDQAMAFLDRRLAGVARFGKRRRAA